MALPSNKEIKRHDDHRLRNESKPNPEKPYPYASHMDAQHRLDSTPLSRAGCTLRHALRRLLKHPLSTSLREKTVAMRSAF